MLRSAGATEAAGPALQEDEGILLGSSSLSEQPDGASRRDREARGELLPDEFEQGAVMAGVGEQQDDAGLAAVSLLEEGAAEDRLEIAHVRLGVDLHPTVGTIDRRVPGPMVHRAHGWEFDDGHLEAPSQCRANSCPEALEESDLGGVTEPMTRRIGPSR